MSPLISEVVVLCWDTPAKSDRNAYKIAAFLGAEATFVSLTTTVLIDGASIRKIVPTCACLIVEAETLAKAVDAMREGATGIRDLTNLADYVLIYGFQPTERHGVILRALSSGGLLGVHPLPNADAKFHVAENQRAWCRQFSGLSLGAVDPSRENSFLEGTSRRQNDALIRAGDKPFFVGAELDGSKVFFLACGELGDLDEQVPRETHLLSWFSRLVPLMMFLRGVLGNRVWHNDNHRACFIIDDPLLKNRYGYLEYRRLTESMHLHRFSTSIAFIPWNYRRSSNDVAELFLSRYGVPRLCIHGCDHIDAEFASTDVESLRGKAQLAMERMRAHRRLFGVPFDDVMVFPQGLFSIEAITALKTSGYLAAVNSDLFPATKPGTLALRDLLDVAVTGYDNFPLFGRRYPHDLAGFAFDLFMGKPVLAVEHHNYFRNGYKSLEAFVERLHGLEKGLEWRNLGAICSCASLTRTVKDGDVHVRFYTSRFSLTNTGTQTQKYLLLPRRAPDGKSPSVTIDGREGGCEREDGQLKIHLSLEAGQTAEFRVLSEGCRFADAHWRGTKIHNARVGIRRLLCEFRDNYVDTNRVLNPIIRATRSSRSAAKLQAVPSKSV